MANIATTGPMLSPFARNPVIGKPLNAARPQNQLEITRKLLPSAFQSSEHVLKLAEIVPSINYDPRNIQMAVPLVGGATVAAAVALLSLADPETTRKPEADDKEEVRSYFNTTGFDRWKRIYGQTDDLNSVQLDIRLGHAQTVEKILEMVKNDGPLEGLKVCDAGCGTGSLSIPLAMEGAIVSASDISSAMVDEAERRAQESINEGSKLVRPRFETRDLESLDGKYHTVACVDVLIHYPQEKAAGMIQHLASLAERRLILSFAPKTWYYSVLKRIGELFPGPSKTTRAYLHSEEDVEAALKAAGWVVRRRYMTATKFYFSRLLEAVPAGSQ